MLNISYCNIQSGQTNIYISDGSILNYLIGNIDSEPCFIEPGYWDSNWTPENLLDDFWVDGDYHLKSQMGRWNPVAKCWIKDDETSLCIDAGDPNSDWIQELWPHGKRMNMGAYGGTSQASMSLSTVGNKANFNNDDTVDFRDLFLLVDLWLAEDILLSEDIGRNGLVNFSDFAEFTSQWLWEE